jgi:signal peptidase II
MGRFNRPQVKWYFVIFSIAIVIIALDQLSKLWIRTNLAVGQSWPEMGFFRLTYAQNTGAAFSIFYNTVGILTIVSLIGVVLLLVYIFVIYRHFPFLDTPINKISLGLLLAGTTGNLIDRLFLHRVTDFIDMGPWPIFNMADMSIVCGVFVFAFSILFINHDANPTQHLKP